MIQVKLDKKAKGVIAKTADFSGGGGTKVVTELPDVGEEHVVYELRQEVPADFPWLLTEITEDYPTLDVPFIVVETEEQVTQEYLVFPGEIKNIPIPVFVKNTNNVYACYIEDAEAGDIFVKNIVHPVEHSLYVNIAVLKDFDYHVTMIPGEQGYTILDGTGHFLDGAEFNYENGSNVVPLVLTEAKNPIELRNSLVGRCNCKNINDISELPTAKQAVDGNMCNSDGFVVCPKYISLQNKLEYDNKQSTDTYSWNSEFQYFVNLEVEDVPENPAHYYGPLEWETYSVSVANKIDLSLLGIETVVFNPQPAHTEVSYWIYTNNEWVNVDEINTEPSLHKTVFGTLTDTGDQTQLQCSLTLKEMADAIAEGNCVVLELYLGDGSRGDYWYCAITEVTGMEAPQPTITATWSLMNGHIYWNRNTGAFGFDNGIM